MTARIGTEIDKVVIEADNSDLVDIGMSNTSQINLGAETDLNDNALINVESINTYEVFKGLNPGYLDLPIQRNATNPAYQVDILPGAARSDDNTTDILVASTITVDLTASGANGLDTGSEAVSTWYYLYLIYNPTTGVAAGLFSTSSSSPTLPGGYTKKRLINSMINNASGDFMKWETLSTGRVREYQYLEETQTALLVLSSGSSQTWADVDCSDLISPLSTLGEFQLSAYAENDANEVDFRPNGSTETSPCTFLRCGGSTNNVYVYNSMIRRMKTGTDQIIEYINSGTNISTYVSVIGYTEVV